MKMSYFLAHKKLDPKLLRNQEGGGGDALPTCKQGDVPEPSICLPPSPQGLLRIPLPHPSWSCSVLFPVSFISSLPWFLPVTSFPLLLTFSVFSVLFLLLSFPFSFSLSPPSLIGHNWKPRGIYLSHLLKIVKFVSTVDKLESTDEGERDLQSYHSKIITNNILVHMYSYFPYKNSCIFI